VGVSHPHRKLGFVVQRYGNAITGGSESLARELAERLAPDYQISVFTTCARDYVTWRNEFDEGVEHSEGIEVRRFASEEERDLRSFNQFSERLYAGRGSQEDELEWLRRQGPFVPRLVKSLEACREDFDAVLFFTYLYYPTYFGLKAAPLRSILVPTAHDEPPLRLGIFQSMFEIPRAFAFCSTPEAELVTSRFSLGECPRVVAGIGVETGSEVDVEAFKIRHDIRKPYALYAGRIDAGKGCEEMMTFYASYRRNSRGAVDLLLIGKLAMAAPRVPGVRYLGYLSEEEKKAAIAGAAALVCPSPYESLSIVMLEGLALGTPALANARSPVLKDHCVRSNAGLFYRDAREFAEALELVALEKGLREALGRNGRRYVQEHYRWEVVLERYRSVIEGVARGDPRGFSTPPKAG